MHLILTYTNSHPRIWVHSSPSFLFPTEFGQHCRDRDSEIFRVMQVSHYAVIHLRYVTKSLILGGGQSGQCGRVATKIFEGFGGFIIGRETVSIVHYTRPGSSIKQPTQNLEATLCHVNWPVFTLKVAQKSPSPL